MFDRDDAFSMNIGDESPIIKTMEIDDNLFIFKTNSIYKLLTADTIDPNKDYSDTRHSYEKLFDEGTTSPYVARILLQFEDIITKVTLDNIDQEAFISHIWKTNQLLLNCNSSLKYIKDKNNELRKVCDQIIEKNKRSGSIPQLPQIPDLKNKVSVFLNSAKMFLIELFKTFNILFEMPIKDKREAFFKGHIQWILDKFESEHALSNVLEQDQEWILLLAELRNALEHPGEGQSLVIKDFCLKPGNKFSEPSWHYDLTKKKLGKSGETNLIGDIEVFIYNMLHFYEETLLLSIKEKLNDNTMFTLYKFNDEQIDILCPIHYSVTFNTSFLKKQKV